MTAFSYYIHQMFIVFFNYYKHVLHVAIQQDQRGGAVRLPLLLCINAKKHNKCSIKNEIKTQKQNLSYKTLTQKCNNYRLLFYSN